MKKLLVLALAAIMVLSLAAVSMAAVTVGGEVNFGWNLIDKTQDGGGNQSQNEFGDAKITATAAINDEVTAFAAIKGATGNTLVIDTTKNTISGLTMVDEAWVKFTEGFGTVKVGYFGWNVKENLDIISFYGDLKYNAGVNVVAKASDAVTVDFFTAEPYDKTTTGGDGGFVYGLKVKYDADVFGVSLATAKNGAYPFDKNTDTAMSLNGYYKMDAFTVYMNYCPAVKINNVKDQQSAIIGATYDSADSPIYARVEFDVQPTKDMQGMGVRLGYKLNGAKLEYQTSIADNTSKDAKAKSYIKLNCAF